MNNRIRFAVLSSIGLAASTCLHAQLNQVVEFTQPGEHLYVVPQEAGQLLVEVAGAAGGAGGWDDAIGGHGAGGAIVSALVQVQGGETVSLIVAEGGEGSLGTPKVAYGVGAGGGGDGTKQTPGALSAPIAGSGGKGGSEGTTNSSPGGAGGGGASAVFVGGASVIAGGGGGGGSNSRIRGPGGTWQVPADDAINALVFNIEDSLCNGLAQGGAGKDGDETAGRSVDGAGGSGGGGGYTNNFGAGGEAGEDRTIDQNAEPGLSGASCILSAGTYKISNQTIALGTPTAPVTGRGRANPDGINGYVKITPLAAPLPPASATPVPALDIFGLMGLAGVIGAAGITMTRRRRQ